MKEQPTNQLTNNNSKKSQEVITAKINISCGINTAENQLIPFMNNRHYMLIRMFSLSFFLSLSLYLLALTTWIIASLLRVMSVQLFVCVSVCVCVKSEKKARRDDGTIWLKGSSFSHAALSWYLFILIFVCLMPAHGYDGLCVFWVLLGPLYA